MQNNRHTIAGGGRRARKLGDVTDHLAGTRTTVGLGVFGVAGQRIDDVASQVRAIGARQRGPLLALEVVVQDELVVIPGKNKVDTGPLELAVEKQLRIR